MKKRRIAALACALLVLLAALLGACSEERAGSVLHGDGVQYSDAQYKISIKSPQGFIYDVQNEEIVFSKGEEKVVYPGSTSKLLTALYALSVLPADAVITAGDELELVKPGSSVAYIKKGHMLSVEMLVEGLLLPSGNDAAYVLAAAVGREIEGNGDIAAADAVAAFMRGLGEYAKSLGLCGTVLTVPDGYAGSEHYTTTEDMIITAKAAMENPVIAKYAAVYKDSVVYASGHTNTWVSTNKLLDPQSEYYSPHATGLKTGSISGEYSLVFSFSFEDGREYIAGVFGADGKNERFEDANVIINYLEELTAA